MPKELIAGLKWFRRDSFPRYRDHYLRLVADGQQPRTLFIGCADSRVVPNLLTDSVPGELFVLRNVGNIVPPFEADQGFHGTSAGIEFATLELGVRDIVVCGHSHCGAIKALIEPPRRASPHMTRWLALARDALVGESPGAAGLARIEQRSVVLQLDRLMTYPMVRERVEEGTLALHGWYYVIEEGTVLAVDVATGELAPLG